MWHRLLTVAESACILMLTSPLVAAGQTTPTGAYVLLDAAMSVSSSDSDVKRMELGTPEKLQRAQNGGVNSGVPPSAPVSPKNFEDEARSICLAYAEYMEALDSIPAGLQSTADMDKAMELDSRIRGLLTTAYGQWHSFEVVRKELDSIVKWVEIPSKLRVGGAASNPPEPEGLELNPIDPRDGGSTPIVLFKRAATATGKELVVCQNALMVKDAGYYFRLRFVPYAVLVTDAAVVTGVLYPEYSEPGQEPGIGGNVWSIIDTYDGGDDVPLVGLVCGPRGNGDYLDIQVATYSSEERKWKLDGAAGFDGNLGWRYDADLNEFTFLSAGETPASDYRSWSIGAQELFLRNGHIRIADEPKQGE